MSRPAQSISINAVKIVAGALIASMAIYAAVGIFIIRTGIMAEDPILGEEQASQAGMILLGAGIAAAVASLLVKRALASRWTGDIPSPAQQMTATVIPLMMCDFAGVMGLIHALLTQTLTVPYVLWGISLAAGILNFPKGTSRLEE